jgi:hypothetical protein
MVEKRRRFAEGTEVEVSKSKLELERLLAKHGAAQLAVFEDYEEGRSVVQFRMSERLIRLEVRVSLAKPLPEPHTVSYGQARGVSTPSGWNSWTVDRRKDWLKTQREQSAREAWRRCLLVTKAKLEIVADGESSLEREFLADVLLPDGRTVHEALAHQLEQAYTDGSLPPMLPPAPETRS